MSALTHDAFLGGRFRLWQPAGGFRSGVDAVLLAAFVPARPGESVLEPGCGAGAASLCLAARVPGVRLVGVELQPDYAALARRNAEEAGAAFEVFEGDIARLPAHLRQRQFDHVMMNPPYFAPGTRRPSQDAGREAARGEAVSLADWIGAGVRRLVPRGSFVVIQRPERLPELLAALASRGLGSIEVLPVQPRAGRDALLVLVRARKGARGPARLRAPLVLHAGARHERDGEDYAPAARAILREAAAID